MFDVDDYDYRKVWSFVEKTPKGVTIHCVDEGIDTGAIIVQKEVFFTGKHTLKSTYQELHQEIQVLFKESWNQIRTGQLSFKEQVGLGSSHRFKDKNPLLPFLLKDGWETPIQLLEDYTYEG